MPESQEQPAEGAKPGADPTADKPPTPDQPSGSITGVQPLEPDDIPEAGPEPEGGEDGDQEG